MSVEPGTRVGDYQILNELGSGGMGRVYRVKNVLSDRIEAMKVLLPDVASRQDLAARFLREIKLLASLNHPNIAALRTALTIDNQLVMIMEYVEGVTLADRLAHGPIPVADTVNYMDQVLNALTYAHQQHIIHRDIKPANIILTPQGVIKVMDFGIARSGDERSLTMTGTTLGSLSYMSPEQVKGEATDARSDLYSVGISLYELVTGQRPFHAHSDYSIMAAHVKEVPKPPIELEQGLPPALNEIILIAIAKDPAQRFQTAEAFRNALRTVPVPAAMAQTATNLTPVTPDAAATATLSVPAVATAPVRAAAVTTSPRPTPVTPIPNPVPSSIPMPPPAQHSSHRGLYMTLGALIVLAVLVAAGIYIPRKSKTQAESAPAQTQPAAAANTASAPDATPAVPAAPVTGSATDTSIPQPPAATEATATPATANAPANNAMSAAPHGAASAKSPRKAQSGPAVNASLQESEGGSGSSAAAASKAAMIDELEQQADQLSNRADAVDASLDRLQQQQSASGYGLRGDIVSRRSSMKTNLSKAQNAVQ